MNLLLDTSTLIMLIQGRPIPERSRLAFEDKQNQVFVSLVSPWEMQIKFNLNKLTLHQPVRTIIEDQLAHGSFRLLSITLAHVSALAGLPHHHRDPFDRLLIAQAIHETLTLVTSDQTIAKYPVPVLWE
jgi:PIN domain nuclease of toxin-antitoxin system